MTALEVLLPDPCIHAENDADYDGDISIIRVIIISINMIVTIINTMCLIGHCAHCLLHSTLYVDCVNDVCGRHVAGLGVAVLLHKGFEADLLQVLHRTCERVDRRLNQRPFHRLQVRLLQLVVQVCLAMHELFFNSSSCKSLMLL